MSKQPQQSTTRQNDKARSGESRVPPRDGGSLSGERRRDNSEVLSGRSQGGRARRDILGERPEVSGVFRELFSALCDLHVGVAGMHPTSGERHAPLDAVVVARAGGRSEAAVRFTPRAEFASCALSRSAPTCAASAGNSSGRAGGTPSQYELLSGGSALTGGGAGPSSAKGKSSGKGKGFTYSQVVEHMLDEAGPKLDKVVPLCQKCNKLPAPLGPSSFPIL